VNATSTLRAFQREGTRVRLRCTALSTIPASSGIGENVEKYLTATRRFCER
jgi:hypothetical protein